MIPVMLIVTFLVYALMLAIPGDPARALIGPGESLDEEQLDYIRKKHNLDKPVIVQYGIWLGKPFKVTLDDQPKTKDRWPMNLNLGP